jgi:hypothetical protein
MHGLVDGRANHGCDDGLQMRRCSAKTFFYPDGRGPTSGAGPSAVARPCDYIPLLLLLLHAGEFVKKMLLLH